MAKKNEPAPVKPAAPENHLVRDGSTGEPLDWRFIAAAAGMLLVFGVVIGGIVLCTRGCRDDGYCPTPTTAEAGSIISDDFRKAAESMSRLCDRIDRIVWTVEQQGYIESTVSMNLGGGKVRVLIPHPGQQVLNEPQPLVAGAAPIEGGCIDAQRIKELERGLRDLEQRVYRLEKAVMDSVVTEPECK